MGYYLRPIKMEKLRHNLPFEPIVLNNLPLYTVKDREALHNLIITTYGKDVNSIEPIPSCYCGGMMSTNLYGKTCDFCNQRVQFRYEQRLVPHLWFEVPEAIGQMFTPVAWAVISSSMTFSGWDPLYYFCTVAGYEPKADKAKAIVRKAKAFGIERGMRWVMRNLDMFLEFIISCSGDKNNELRTFILNNRDALVTTCLPIPSKVSFIIERTALADWAKNAPLRQIMEAVTSVMSLDGNVSVRRLENKVAAMNKNIADYFISMAGEIGQKHNILRDTVFSGRTSYTLRGVITSISEPHEFDTIRIPMPQAIVMLRFIVYNHLVNRYGYTDATATAFIESNTAKPCELMVKIMNDILAETPGGRGIYCLATRYPSLDPASTQRLRITGYANNIRLSTLVLYGPNADFDGDEITLAITLDQEYNELFTRQSPWYSIDSFSKVFTLTKNTAMPKLTCNVWANYIQEEKSCE